MVRSCPNDCVQGHCRRVPNMRIEQNASGILGTKRIGVCSCPRTSTRTAFACLERKAVPQAQFAVLSYGVIWQIRDEGREYPIISIMG